MFFEGSGEWGGGFEGVSVGQFVGMATVRVSDGNDANEEGSSNVHFLWSV